MQVRVSYFALFREAAGKNEELVDTSAAIAGELYRELAARYGFTLAEAQVKVAVNDVFAEHVTQLRQGDHVIFIPPIAGG